MSLETNFVGILVFSVYQFILRSVEVVHAHKYYNGCMLKLFLGNEQLYADEKYDVTIHKFT